MINLPNERRLVQSPQDDAKTIYFQWLSQAKKSVLIVDYSFNLQDFIAAITNFVKAGIGVHVVLGKSQAPGNYTVK